MRTVEVNLHSLRLLISECLKTKIHDRAQTIVFNEGRIINPDAATRYVNLVERAKPQAEKSVRPRCEELLDAIESGNDVSEALTRFIG
jgi:hypothetical protein